MSLKSSIKATFSARWIILWVQHCELYHVMCWMYCHISTETCFFLQSEDVGRCERAVWTASSPSLRLVQGCEGSCGSLLYFYIKLVSVCLCDEWVSFSCPLCVFLFSLFLIFSSQVYFFILSHNPLFLSPTSPIWLFICLYPLPLPLSLSPILCFLGKNFLCSFCLNRIIYMLQMTLLPVCPSSLSPPQPPCHSCPLTPAPLQPPVSDQSGVIISLWPLD